MKGNKVTAQTGGAMVSAWVVNQGDTGLTSFSLRVKDHGELLPGQWQGFQVLSYKIEDSFKDNTDHGWYLDS